MTDHECAESPDPRRASACIKCGRRINGRPVLEVDYDYRRIVLQVAADAVGHEHLADRLELAADYRTDLGPVSLANGRDLLQEMIEELLDAVGNYGPWELQRLRDQDTEPERAAGIAEALRHGVLMYDALLRAAER
jgi:hypothetical protein